MNELLNKRITGLDIFCFSQLHKYRIVLVIYFLLFIAAGCKNVSQKKVEDFLSHGKEDKAVTFSDLRAYTGKAAAKKIIDEDRRKAYLLNYKQLKINYGKNVEYQLRREQVILCPQTVDFLYSRFTPVTTRYIKGTRPKLEKVVNDVTINCETESEKVLGLMRFCRDLYKKDPDANFADYIYGGTEEQLIEKPEILCETLSRLMVALCEVIGIPGRIIMHDIGGHICTEILVDGNWGYIDPRTGIYFLNKDASFASVRELCQDPSIISSQSSMVKADVGDRWTWEYRAWKCEYMYFNPKDINGFQNYSLADSKRYSYSQISDREATVDGLYVINKQYVNTIRKVFEFSKDWNETNWGTRKLQKIPIAYRHDGFTPYFKEFLITREYLEQNYVDCFENTNAKTLVWGLGPGSVFCYETKIGEIFGEGLNDKELSMLRTGDRWVHKNVMNLVKEGGPLRIAVEQSHKNGLEIFARLEMNHEYGPASPDNWMWVGFVGNLNKKNPEYRIGKTVHLDFKHEEVRQFKMAILREAAEYGVDGVSMDFAVYPPFFEKPDTAIMTQFVRDVRKMLDEIGQQQQRQIKLMVRVPFEKYIDIGLDWKTWMDEQLIDIIVPTHLRFADYFDIRIEEFVETAKNTGTLVYPTIWQKLGFVNTDPHPSDEKSGRKRYDKPKTKEMFFAQALLFNRSGVDGLQLGFAADEWKGKPWTEQLSDTNLEGESWVNELADPDKTLFADKQYMVDPVQLLPGTFELTRSGTKYIGQRTVGLRIGDNIPEARKKGYDIKSRLVVYMRTLQSGEKLGLYINGNGPVIISGDSDEEKKRRDMTAINPHPQKYSEFVFEKDWWKRSMHEVTVDENWWRLRDNAIKLVYSNTSTEIKTPLSIIWIDLLLNYKMKDN
jgi:hypothetical protein